MPGGGDQKDVTLLILHRQDLDSLGPHSPRPTLLYQPVQS